MNNPLRQLLLPDVSHDHSRCLNCFHLRWCARRSGRGGALSPHQALGGVSGQAIAYCLAKAGISLADVDYVTVNQDSRVNFVGKLCYVPSQRPDPAQLWIRWRIRRARPSWPGRRG